MLAAVQGGRLEFASPEDMAWLSGVLRNLAAGSARREIRRRRREARWTDAVTADNGLHVPSDGADAKFLKHLSESTRRVAVLAVHGMNADEIQYVLGDGHDGPFATGTAGSIELVFIPRAEPADCRGQIQVSEKT